MSGGLWGQATSSSAPAVEKPVHYVRRFSAGPTLSVFGLPTIKPRTTGYSSGTNPSTTYIWDTKAATPRVGYGATVQFAISGHLAVAGSVLLHKLGYIMTNTVTTTTTSTSTGATTVATTSTREDTRSRIMDIPVVMRFYTKDRHRPGPRAFLEGGAALRKVSQIRSSTSTTDVDGNTTCCNTTPAVPANRNVRGLVAGFGVQVIDPVGIRLVPEVRYTRWTNATFNSFSTLTQRNQIEVLFSLTF